MKQTLSPAQIFRAAKIPKSLSGLAVQDLVLDKKARTMSFTLMCTSPCPRCDVYKLKAALVDAYMLRECAISVRYENVTLCDEFLAAYKENVIWELRQKAAVYAYIFLDSEWQAEPDAVRIMLRHGCGQLLAESKADAAIEKQFSDELSLSVSVEFIEDISQVDFDLPPIEYIPAATSQKAEDKPLKPLIGGVLVGKEIKGEPVSLDTVTQDSGSVIVAGDIISVDIRELREKKLLVMFNMTDYDNSITCKFFTPADKFEQIKDEIKVGKTVMVRGEANMTNMKRTPPSACATFPKVPGRKKRTTRP